jgi:FKBP-type peptidyl-prolyl cis-trans isomerase
VELQVIEELTFDPGLDIDLTAMEVTATGVYIRDIVVGEGGPLVWGDQPIVRYQGWLANGTRFDSGEFGFLMGNNQVVPGFEQGIFGMRVGGVRQMIIPPVLAYGTRGVGLIPPGSVLVFEVQVLEAVRATP